MQTVDEPKQTLGEVFKDKDHILSHIEESYYVPSLLMRAFETMPHSQAMGWAIAAKWQPSESPDKLERTISSLDGFMRSQLQKMLSRYILRQLGQAA